MIQLYSVCALTSQLAKQTRRELNVQIKRERGRDQRYHILRALLVSGLSPRAWRIFSSEKQPAERNFKMASARRRI